MGIFIAGTELERLNNAPQSGKQQEFYRALKKRVCRNTQEDSLVQSADTQEWYHLCWERISDASFVCRVERDQRIGRWLHDRVMEIVRMDTDKWVGPWYRQRGEVLLGSLETSHILLAVCEAVDNCPFLFTREELDEAVTAVREKGRLLCMRYCDSIAEGRNHINNWFMVILDGFGTAAVLLKEEAMVQKAVQWSHLAASLYSRNDYGESVQYSNYATLHLAHLNETLLRSGYVQENELDLQCYTNIMDWYAASFLYCKPLSDTGKAYPRAVNFGDSAAIFRPSADILVHVAVRMKKKAPKQAGLAAWMFHTMYQDPCLGPDELAGLGLFNQYQYYTVLNLPDMARAVSPKEAGLPCSMSFEGGQIISRDRIENPRTVVALQAGGRPFHVTAHRHKDQNSFQLICGQERMLVDPGHCCYRLRAQKEAVSELCHNTFSIRKNGEIMEQREVEGNIFLRKEPGNRLLCNYFWKNVQLTASDAAGLYDDTIQKAVRIWIMDLPYRMFVIDVVEASVPVSLCTHFCANNRDNALRVHRATPQRLVLRRGGQALKLFEAYSETDGREVKSEFHFDWTAMHNYYHPLENQEGQGREGSVCRYLWEGAAGRKHLRIHTLVMDGDREIVGWHVYPVENGYIRITSPGDTNYLDAKVTDNSVMLRNELGEEHKMKIMI